MDRLTTTSTARVVKARDVAYVADIIDEPLTQPQLAGTRGAATRL